VRRSRWRRYLPGAVLAALSLPILVFPTHASIVGTELGLAHETGIVLAGAIAVGVTTLAAALADRSPPAYLVAGAFALNAGALLTSGRWPAAFLLALAVGSILVWEVARLFEGLTIGETTLSIHRGLRETLDLEYEDVIAVHSTAKTDAGTLIVETDHGTVTVNDLPQVEQVQARVEARVHRPPISTTAESIEDAHDRIARLVGGARS
jgi:branched-subunit amino acid transport protein